jgi:nicotinamidase-related amidase
MSSRSLGDYDRDYILREAQKAYQEDEADFEFGARRTALVIVDMLDEFVKPNWSPYWVPDATEQIPKIQELIATCRKAEVPIIYTAYKFHEAGIDVPRGAKYIPIYRMDLELLGQIFTKPSVYEEIAPEPGDLVLLKPTYDAFYGTKLDLVLKNMDIENVIICGTMTNFCCGSTARAAFMQGYNVVFGSDINSSDDPTIHESELKTLRRGFARIMTCDEIIAKLSKPS